MRVLGCKVDAHASFASISSQLHKFDLRPYIYEAPGNYYLANGFDAPFLPASLRTSGVCPFCTTTTLNGTYENAYNCSPGEYTMHESTQYALTWYAPHLEPPYFLPCAAPLCIHLLPLYCICSSSASCLSQIHTGSKQLDALLGGGIETGTYITLTRRTGIEGVARILPSCSTCSNHTGYPGRPRLHHSRSHRLQIWEIRNCICWVRCEVHLL